jgi:osmoprotectant transport system ATP-binding protein
VSAVSLQSVTKTLGNRVVLDDVSLALPRDEVTAILGESGCGKTTLLHHLNGLLQPDSGRVELFGEPLDYARLSSARRRMGYAVQGVGLFPHLTMVGNLGLMARLEGWETSRIDERRRRLMRMMELDEELVDRYPHELSGGQRQRFGICRAMMLEPDLLLLDEPFSGVDTITRGRIHEEMSKLLRTEPATTVLVTHDVREALRLGTYLVVMDSGRIVQNGDVDDVLRAPANAAVAKLFADQLDGARQQA